MKKATIGIVSLWVGLVGGAASILSFIAAQVAQRSVGEILQLSLVTPVWSLLLAGGLLLSSGVALGRLWSRTRLGRTGFSSHRSSGVELMMHDTPHRVTSRNKNSVTPFPGHFVSGTEGSLACWIYLHPFGEGIRRLENNRYIFGHDTNNGNAVALDGKRRYVNVFALARGPRSSYDPPTRPVWKIWIANGSGDGKSWKLEDSTELEPSWHHFMVRWNHRVPLLELLIDSKCRLSAADYLDFWPDYHDSQAFLGCWQSLADVHFIETYICRFAASTQYLEDSWIVKELGRFRPVDVRT